MMIPTQLPLNEENWPHFFEAVGSAVILVEEDGTISLANEGFERLSGYTREEVENKKSWTEFFMEMDHAGNGTPWRRAAPDIHHLQTKMESIFIDRESRAKSVSANVMMLPAMQKCVVSMVDITPLRH